MDKVILGKTGLEVNKNGFGALPVQRVEKKEAIYLLQKAFYNGINYFDTARAYSDSEEKMGADTRSRVKGPDRHQYEIRRPDRRGYAEGSGREPAHAEDGSY